MSRKTGRPASSKSPSDRRILYILILFAAIAGAVWAVGDLGLFGYLSKNDRVAISRFVSDYYADYARNINTNKSWRDFIGAYAVDNGKGLLIAEANGFIRDSLNAKQRRFEIIDILNVKILDHSSDKAAVFVAAETKSNIWGLLPEIKIDRDVFYLKKIDGRWFMAWIEPYVSVAEISLENFEDSGNGPAGKLEETASASLETPADILEAGAIIMRLTGDTILMKQTLSGDYGKNVENFLLSKRIDLTDRILDLEKLRGIIAASGLRSSVDSVSDFVIDGQISRAGLGAFAEAVVNGEKRADPAPTRNVVCLGGEKKPTLEAVTDQRAWAEVDYPNGGQSFAPGDQMTVNWRSSGTSLISDDKSIRISLLKGSAVISSIITENDGTETVILRPERPIGSDYRIALSYAYDYIGCCDEDCLSDCRFKESVIDQSDADFCLVSPFGAENP